MRLMEDMFSWKKNTLSPANFDLTTQNKNKIKVNRINQGVSWAGWNPSLEMIMKTETHQRI